MEKDYLFSSAFCELDLPLPPAIKSTLLAVETKLLGQPDITIDEANHWIQTLQQIADLLMNPIHRNTLQAALNKKHTGLWDIFKEELGALSKNFPVIMILPVGVRVPHYNSCIHAHQQRTAN